MKISKMIYNSAIFLGANADRIFISEIKPIK